MIRLSCCSPGPDCASHTITELVVVPVTVDQHRTDQNRCTDRGGRGRDVSGGVGVAQRIDVGGVLRPDHDVRGVDLTATDLRGEFEGLRNVIVEDRACVAR